MNLFDEIVRIISDCEDVQHSNESEFTKEKAKVHAYDEIMETLRNVFKREEK